jgi:hypothetical protein
MRTHIGRRAILAAHDLEIEEVEVPEWGTWVRVRGLTGAERDAYEASLLGGTEKDAIAGSRTEPAGPAPSRSAGAAGTAWPGGGLALRNARARLVALCCIDEHGRRLFSDDDVDELGNKSAAALNRLFETACRLSGLSAADLAELSKN